MPRKNRKARRPMEQLRTSKRGEWVYINDSRLANCIAYLMNVPLYLTSKGYSFRSSVQLWNCIEMIERFTSGEWEDDFEW